MPKRFTPTTIWDEDWFFEMPFDHKMFWFYINHDCDYAGFWTPKYHKFNVLSQLAMSKEDLQQIVQEANNGIERVQVLPSGKWFLPWFFSEQYGTIYNGNNRVHASVKNVMRANGLDLGSIRGLVEVKEDSTRS